MFRCVIETKHKVMISFRFDIEFERNFRLKNEKFYLFLPKNIKAIAVLENIGS
jgi:hypothetical protein